MNTLQNIFNGQLGANSANMPINGAQQNIIMQLMGMNEQQRAEKIAEILNQRGITKEQLENLIKNAKNKRL